jgi:proline dehydrogenase
LRIPDAETADALLREKLGSSRWSDAPDDGSLMASAADWALMLTGTLARWADEPDEDLAARVRRIVARLGEPVVRGACGRRCACCRAVRARRDDRRRDQGRAERRPLRFSYDMLGEGARSAEDATRYFDSYARRSAPSRRATRRPGHRPRRHLGQAFRAASALRGERSARVYSPSCCRGSARLRALRATARSG